MKELALGIILGVIGMCVVKYARACELTPIWVCSDGDCRIVYVCE